MSGLTLFGSVSLQRRLGRLSTIELIMLSFRREKVEAERYDYACFSPCHIGINAPSLCRVMAACRSPEFGPFWSHMAHRERLPSQPHSHQFGI